MADIRLAAKIDPGMPIPSLVFLGQTVRKLFDLLATTWIKWWSTSVPLIICIIALCWALGSGGISLVWTIGFSLSQWLRIFLTFLFTGVLILLVPLYLWRMKYRIIRHRPMLVDEENPL
jgi:asparagine N-glycosylation enzyme membrane subunit Stt3